MESKIKEKEFRNWLENRVTREYLDTIIEHRNAIDILLSDAIKNATKLRDLDLGDLEQYRGQMYAMDTVLDVETFLSEKLELERIVTDDVQLQTSPRLSNY